MKFRYCSLENFNLVVMFAPRRLKNPRKRGSITTKRVRSNYSLRVDEIGVVVASGKSDCMVKTFKLITRSDMKVFVESDEETMTDQECASIMRGIDEYSGYQSVSKLLVS